MNDQTTGEEQKVEAPTKDVPASESQEPVVDQPQTQPQESAETETAKNEEGEAPKDNATWAAMRIENKRLKDQLDSVDPRYFESVRNATAPQPYQPPNLSPISDDAEYTQVTHGINQAQSRAANAEREVAQLRQQMELQQDREAERAYPELKTNKVFQQIVAEKKLVARVLGHQRTTLEIADEVATLLKRREEEVVAKTAQETEKKIAQKQVISSEPKGHSSGGRSVATNEDLRQRVRRGDSSAQTEVAKGLIADLEF